MRKGPITNTWWNSIREMILPPRRGDRPPEDHDTTTRPINEDSDAVTEVNENTHGDTNASDKIATIDNMILQKDFYLDPSQWSAISKDKLRTLAQNAAAVVPILSTGGRGIPVSMAHRASRQMAESLLKSLRKNDNVMLITGNDRLEVLDDRETGAVSPCLAVFLSNELTKHGVNVDIVYIAKEDPKKLLKMKVKLSKYIRLAKDATNYVLWYDPKTEALALASGNEEELESSTRADRAPPKELGKHDEISFTGRVFEWACEKSKRVDVFAAYVADIGGNPNPQWSKIHLFGDDDNPEFNGLAKGILSFVQANTETKVTIQAFTYAHVLGNEDWKSAFVLNEDSNGIEWTKVFEKVTGRNFELLKGDGIRVFTMK